MPTSQPIRVPTTAPVGVTLSPEIERSTIFEMVPLDMIGKMNAYRNVHKSNDAYSAWGKTVREIYNTGLRPASRLPEWPDMAYSEAGRQAVSKNLAKYREETAPAGSQASSDRVKQSWQSRKQHVQEAMARA